MLLDQLMGNEWVVMDHGCGEAHIWEESTQDIIKRTHKQYNDLRFWMKILCQKSFI
jgi:hypothetical protein